MTNMYVLTRRTAIAALASVYSVSRAQTASRILCGFPAGGPVDLISRMVAEELSKETGRPFVVENKSGVGGAIAVRTLVSAPADGTTYLVAPSSNIVVYPHTVAKPGYDVLADLMPVASVGGYALGFGVKNDPKVPDLKGYIALAKTDPRLTTYGSPGAGSLPHFYGLLVAAAIGVPLTHVPYRGAGQAMIDVIGGTLGAVVTPIGQMMEQKNPGSLRVLAMSGAQRGTRAPDVPTFTELGYRDLVTSGWYGVFAPKGTHAAEVAKVNQVLNRAFQRPDLRARLAAVDVDPVNSSPAAFTSDIESEYRSWQKVVRESGFKGEG